MNNLSQNTVEFSSTEYPMGLISQEELKKNSLLKKADGVFNNKVNVKIMGQDYILQGDANSDYILSLVRYIELKVNELKKISPKMDTKRMAILAAINICDELFQLQKKSEDIPNKEELDKIESKTNNIISLLEHSIVGLHEE